MKTKISSKKISLRDSFRNYGVIYFIILILYALLRYVFRIIALAVIGVLVLLIGTGAYVLTRPVFIGVVHHGWISLIVASSCLVAVLPNILILIKTKKIRAAQIAAKDEIASASSHSMIVDDVLMLDRSADRVRLEALWQERHDSEEPLGLPQGLNYDDHYSRAGLEDVNDRLHRLYSDLGPPAGDGNGR